MTTTIPRPTGLLSFEVGDLVKINGNHDFSGKIGLVVNVTDASLDLHTVSGISIVNYEKQFWNELTLLKKTAYRPTKEYDPLVEVKGGIIAHYLNENAVPLTMAQRAVKLANGLVKRDKKGFALNEDMLFPNLFAVTTEGVADLVYPADYNAEQDEANGFTKEIDIVVVYSDGSRVNLINAYQKESPIRWELIKATPEEETK